MLTAALFTMAKTWKHLISTDRGMDKEDVVHVYSELLLSHKKNEIMLLTVSVSNNQEHPSLSSRK